MKTLLLSAAILLLGSGLAPARTYVWEQSPATDQWQDTANWSPSGIPHKEGDTAVFAASDVTDIILGLRHRTINGSETFLDSITFQAGAPTYTITLTPNGNFGNFLIIDGAGIVNNSGVTQNIMVDSTSTQARSAELHFSLQATIGDNVIITNLGGKGDGSGGGTTTFGVETQDVASAGNATIINEGAIVSGGGGGGTLFEGYAGAANATFINNPGSVAGALGGTTIFYTDRLGNVGSSTFICNAATVAGAGAGSTEIDEGGDGGGISAGATYLARGAAAAGVEPGQVRLTGGRGYATFVAEGGTGSGAAGGLITVNDPLYNENEPYLPQTILVAQPGSNGGLGGTIAVQVNDALVLSQLETFGNGLIDFSTAEFTGITIGSLFGDGLVNLGSHIVNVGNNNLSSLFSGVISGPGTINKIGAGTLTLSGGGSTYTGGTFINGGAILVANTTGSATSRGQVIVRIGMLGGNGIVAGRVVVGASDGTPGGYLAPSFGAPAPVTFTTQSLLTFNNGGVCSWLLEKLGESSLSDLIVANGVSIASGAQINLVVSGNAPLRRGRVLTVISNTAATPIAGAFANLPDGSNVVLNGTTLQANYEGGDGNDLTLTAQ
jgi:autotransporter-associated beta strand protein